MKRKELIEYRTPNTKHFLKKDGTIEVEIYKEPVHYLKKGKYEEIDTSLVKTSKGYKSKNNNFKVNFDNSNSDANIGLSFKGKKLIMSYNDIKFKNTINNTITYTNKNIDLEYKVLSNQLKESIILHKKIKENKFNFIVNTNLTLKLNEDNTISFINKNKEYYRIEKPYMIDSNNDISEDIIYNLKKIDNGYEITIIPDKEWLQDSKRLYPITIDPTITNTQSDTNVIDTFIYSGDDNIATYNRPDLKVGVSTDNIVYRTLLKFDLPNIPAGYKITEANLELISSLDAGVTGELIDNKICIHKLTKDWPESEAKWNDMHNAYDNRIYDYFVANKSTLNEYSINNANITKLVQEWYNNPDENYGLMLKDYDETYSEEKELNIFYSKNIANGDLKPTIVIKCKDFNGLESYLSYTSQQHYFGNSHISNYTGNLTSTFNVANTIGGQLPVSIFLVYNTTDVELNKDYGYGIGIKPNLLQTIECTQEEREPLKYLDEDGTIHYFYPKYEENQNGQITKTNEYNDEDGLGLTITYKDNKYIMTDKNNNSNIFINHNGKYYLEEIIDTNNKKIKIIYNNDIITKIIDANNNEINIEYTDNKITFISPHLTTELNYTNNKLTSIISLENTETITYNNKGLIEKIINPNGLIIKYEYKNNLSNRISKVSEISREGNEGKYLLFDYNYDDTKITDNKGRTNTYIFNTYGNVIGTTSLENENNLNNAYGKTYSFGNKEESNTNKLIADKSLIKYIDNLINDSSFESGTSQVFNSTHIDNTNIASKTYSRSGEYSLMVEIPRGGESIYKTFNVEKGKKYAFSVYIKAMDYSLESDSSLDLFLYYDNKYEVTHISKLTDDFVRYSVSIDYDENALEDLNVVIRNTSAGHNSFYLDDMQLEEGETPNYYNLIDNSSFKYGTNDWKITTRLTEDNQIPKEAFTEVVNIANTKALKIHSAPLDTVMVTKKFNISGKSGETFNLSFWYKNDGIFPNGYIGSMGSGINATIFFYYKDNEESGTGIPLIPLNVGSDNWQFFSENFITEFDYDNFEVRINSFNNANDCYITNFSLFKDLESHSYSYDDKGNLVSSTSLNKETTNLKYDKNNQLISTLSPMGSNYMFEYDNNVTDRCIKAISPTGITNQVIYDSNGNPIKSIINNRNTFEEIDNNKLYYIRAKGTNKYFYINPDKTLRVKESECSYDKFYIIKNNNCIKIKHAILNNYYLKESDNSIKLIYGDYDNEFKLISYDNKSYSIVDELNRAFTINNDCSITISDWNSEDYNQELYFEQSENKLFIESSAEYTNDGRFIKYVKDSLGNVTTYNINPINGLTNSIIDPNNNSTNYIYDSKFRTTKITKGNHQVDYEYDINNNLSKIIHGTKNYIFNYDEFNNTSSVKVNNRTLVNNIFEPNNGNLSKIKYGNKNEVNYTYDKFDRVKTIAKSNDTYTNYYDNLGRVSRLTSDNDIYNYEYDFANRLSSFKYNNYSTSYDYDKDNIVTKKIEELGLNKYTYNYTYNTESALTNLNVFNNNFNYVYDKLGRLTESNINNTYSTKYNYITRGNKTSTVIDKVDDNGTIYSYTYDKLGNMTEIKKDNILTNKYYYDMHSQLIKEDDLINNYTKEYIYDNYGNILSKKTYTYNTTNLIKEDTYEYNDSSWQDLLTKFNNESITYDMIGNPTSIGNKTLTWINGRELSTYNDGTNNISYKYNLDGIRTSKIVNGVETKYYLEGRTIIFEDRNGTMLYYIYNGDELLGFVYNNNTYYYHKNIFGDIIGILDSNYSEVVSYEYDSYGALVNITDNSNINLGTINPFRYRSYYYDNETKLYYLNSRYYNPQVGRFINADKVITGQEVNSTNIFIYCGNNSLAREDSNGNWFTPTKEKKYKKVKGYSFLEALKEKIFNKKSKKDLLENTANCYEFATGLTDRFDKLLEDDYSIEELKEAVIKEQKNAGREVREVDGPNSYVAPNEYMIAMRITENPILFRKDYHFMVRYDDGTWAEKKGLSSSNRIIGTPESFGAWSPRMNSETKYLVITKD